jgi:hypothetical protein
MLRFPRAGTADKRVEAKEETKRRCARVRVATCGGERHAEKRLAASMAKETHFTCITLGGDPRKPASRATRRAGFLGAGRRRRMGG